MPNCGDAAVTYQLFTRYQGFLARPIFVSSLGGAQYVGLRFSSARMEMAMGDDYC